jgi:hypothetical protein
MRDITFITEGNRKFTALKARRQRIRRLEAMERVRQFKADVVPTRGKGLTTWIYFILFIF